MAFATFKTAGQSHSVVQVKERMTGKSLRSRKAKGSRTRGKKKKTHERWDKPTLYGKRQQSQRKKHEAQIQ